jgi:hypothetical protein
MTLWVEGSRGTRKVAYRRDRRASRWEARDDIRCQHEHRQNSHLQILQTHYPEQNLLQTY